MSNQIQFQSFNFKSNSVRVITDVNQEPWFCANDVCNILGYSNPRDAISKHCKEKGVAKRDTLTSRGNQETTFINEPNLYRLIIKSRKPEAEPFETWVFEEVLPQIRKTGQYQLQQQLALPEPEKTFSFELTQDNIHNLVWLLFSHSQMNWLLGKLIKPLEAIGSSYSPAVVGHHNEYKRHYRDCLPLIQQFIAPLKQANPQEWQQLQRRLSDK